MHNRTGCGNNYDGRKNWKYVPSCRNDLCKLPFFFRRPGPCGKPLWKKMWRMWKSMSFQQIFAPSEKPPGYVDNSPVRLHPYASRSRKTGLRQWKFRERNGRKAKKLFEYPSNVSVKTFSSLSLPHNFCEFLQKTNFVCSAPSGKYFQ